MAYKEVSRLEVTEVIRQWQSGRGSHEVSRSTGLSRNTIRKYILNARSCGLERDGPPPTDIQLVALLQLNRPGPHKVVIPADKILEPWEKQIEQWIKKDRLKLTRIQDLLAQNHCLVAYTTLRRYVSRKGWSGKGSNTTVRMADTDPGQMAEVDFGRMGTMWDPEKGRKRVVWGMLTVLNHSRHCFLWPLFSQQQGDVIEGLEATWAFFGGIPRYLVLDNFPAAVVGPDPLNPRMTRGFLEYAQHRGFIADPTRPSHPKDKPKVEKGISYVKERFFKGGQFHSLTDMRSQARQWCLGTAGQRVHGTHPSSAISGLSGGGTGHTAAL